MLQLLFTVALHVATLVVHVPHPGVLYVTLYGTHGSASMEELSSFSRKVSKGTELYEFPRLAAGHYYVVVRLGDDEKHSTVVEVVDE